MVRHLGHGEEPGPCRQLRHEASPLPAPSTTVPAVTGEGSGAGVATRSARPPSSRGPLGGGRRPRVEEGGPHARPARAARSPAAVVPPGEVTAARSSAGRVAGLGEQPGRAEQGLDGERLGHVAGQADEHAGVDERLGHEEHVGRTRARQPGDRVEQLSPAPGPPRRPRRGSPSAQSRSSSPAARAGGDGARPRRPAPACSAWPARPRRRRAERAPRALAVGTPAAIDRTRPTPAVGERPAGDRRRRPASRPRPRRPPGPTSAATTHTGDGVAEGRSSRRRTPRRRRCPTARPSRPRADRRRALRPSGRRPRRRAGSHAFLELHDPVAEVVEHVGVERPGPRRPP